MTTLANYSDVGLVKVVSLPGTTGWCVATEWDEGYRVIFSIVGEHPLKQIRACKRFMDRYSLWGD